MVVGPRALMIDVGPRPRSSMWFMVDRISSPPAGASLKLFCISVQSSSREQQLLLLPLRHGGGAVAASRCRCC